MIERIRSGVQPLEALTAVLSLLGLGLWLLAVRQTDIRAMTGLGLISALSWPYWLGLGVVIAGFCISVVDGRTVLPLLPMAVLVVFLYGIAPALEPGRLIDSFIHSGYVDYVARHGRDLPPIDARASWPGGFALGAFDSGLVGMAPLSMLRWAPLGFELAYLPALVALARSSGLSPLAGWMGIGLFYAFNWTEQDYFSPQAVAFLLYLSTLAVVLWLWRPASGPIRVGQEPGSRRAGWLRLSGPEPSLDPRMHAVVVGLVVILILAMVATHQLTPYALVLDLGVLWIARRAPLEMPLVATVATLSWLAFAATDFWIHHRSVLFGQIGLIGSSVSANLTARIHGSGDHRLIVDLRVVMTAALLVLAAAGLRRAGSARWVLGAMTLVPFVLLGAQSYGGEALIRAFLYALPFASLLAGAGLTAIGGRELRSLVCWLVLSVAVVGLTLTRGGNDPYVSFTSTELAGATYLYRHATAGEVLGAASPYAPLGQFQAAGITLMFGDPGGTLPPGQAAAALKHAGVRWIYLSETQERFAEIVAGRRPGWLGELRRYLLSDGYHVERQWPDAVVLSDVH